MRSRGQPEDDVIRACWAAGLSGAVIAAGIGRSENHVRRRFTALGLRRAGPPGDVPEPRPGEDWRERLDLGVRVSSQGRVASLKTGLLLKITVPAQGEPYVTVRVGRPDQTTRRVANLVWECFGEGDPVRRVATWSAAEDATIRRHDHVDAALADLPGRTRWAVLHRARKLRHFLSRATGDRSAPPVRGSVPWLDPVWSEAHAVVPRGLPWDVRDDLIADLVLMRLEGRAPDMRAALKVALRERNAMTGRYKECSLDAPIPGTDGLRRIDLLTDDCERI